MNEAWQQIIDRVQMAPKERDLFYKVLLQEGTAQQVEKINRILFSGDPMDAKVLMCREENCEKSILFSLAYLLRIAGLEAYFKEKEIPSEQFDRLLSVWREISDRSARKYGFYGLNGVYRRFLYSYTVPTRFTLGRLMFEMGSFGEAYSVYQTEKGIVPVLDGEKAPQGICVLQKGNPVLHVHIPEGGKLLPEEVDRSFALAKGFFSRYFPDFSYKAFVCSSWLLDPNLEALLKPDSNILLFQRRFTIACTAENKVSLYWHIFQTEDFVPLEDLTPKNAFQERILAYLQAGNCLYSGKGFRMA